MLLNSFSVNLVSMRVVVFLSFTWAFLEPAAVSLAPSLPNALGSWATLFLPCLPQYLLSRPPAPPGQWGLWAAFPDRPGLGGPWWSLNLPTAPTGSLCCPRCWIEAKYYVCAHSWMCVWMCLFSCICLCLWVCMWVWRGEKYKPQTGRKCCNMCIYIYLFEIYIWQRMNT